MDEHPRSVQPVKAAGLATLVGGFNPKSVLLIAAGTVAVAQTGIAGGELIATLVIFVLIASLGIAIPVVLNLALGERSQRTLNTVKDWMADNNTVIMAVILLIFGVKLVGEAISGLTG